MPKMNARRCITESPHRRMEVQPYYASQWRFTLANGWLVPGNLGGIADRLLLADGCLWGWRRKADLRRHSQFVYWLLWVSIWNRRSRPGPAIHAQKNLRRE